MADGAVWISPSVGGEEARADPVVENRGNV